MGSSIASRSDTRTDICTEIGRKGNEQCNRSGPSDPPGTGCRVASARTLRLRLGPVRRHREFVLRAPPSLRQSDRPACGDAARPVRGLRTFYTGCPRATLGAHHGDLRAREPEAGVLPFHGVPDRTLAHQQRDQSLAAGRRPARPRAESPRLADLLEQEPDPGLGNGGLGRLAACFLDSMATLRLPAVGYGLRYEYGMFKQSIQDGWQQERPDNWLRQPDPWEIARLDERVEVRFGCSFALRGSNLELIPNRPSTLIGIPFDRPIVGYGGTTVNTLRLWSAIAPDYFDFQRFSAGEFVGALAETLAAESLTRVLYP